MSNAQGETTVDEVLELRRVVCDLLKAIYLAPASISNEALQGAYRAARSRYIALLSEAEARRLTDAVIAAFKRDGIEVTNIARSDLATAVAGVGDEMLEMFAGLQQ